MVLTGESGFKVEHPCLPQRNSTREVFNFLARKQLKNEPFDKFFADLKCLAKKCDFGGQEERILKAQIVLGVESETLHQRISREDISLERVVLHCVAAEVAERKHQQTKIRELVEISQSPDNVIKSSSEHSNMGEVNKLCSKDLHVLASDIKTERESVIEGPAREQPDLPFPGNFLLVDVKTEKFNFDSFQPKQGLLPTADFPSQDEYLRAFQPSNEETLLPEVDEASYNQATEIVEQYMANMGVVSKPHTCFMCGEAFSGKENLTKHYYIKHIEEKAYTCNECGKQFTLKARLERHQLTHLLFNVYKCQVCDQEFLQKPHLEQHQVMHVESSTLNCLECPKTFPRRHEQVHLKVKRFKCGVCEKPFSRKEQMLIHQTAHSGLKPLECPECGKRFARKDCFLVHKKKHSEVRRFYCDECGKSFSRKDNLVAHQRTHTDLKKPFSCQECGKSFSRETNLTRHRLLHSEVRLYKCTQCEKSFSRKEHLVGHELLHLEVKPYECNQCGKSFARKEHLVKHQKSIHAVNVMNLVDIVLKK